MIYRYGNGIFPKENRSRANRSGETALREVEEETGAGDLKITGDQFATTYHSYRYQGNNVLKMTAWFRMTAKEGTFLKPQTEEGIEKTEWVSREDLDKYLEAASAST